MRRRTLIAFVLPGFLLTGIGTLPTARPSSALPPHGGGWSLVPAAAAAEAAAKKETEYLPLGDFTLNLPQEGRRTGYVVVGLTIEARPDAAAALKAISPRVREAVLGRLMDMTSRGEIRPGHTDSLALKDNMLATITKLQPEGVRDVLITRILYT
jgi:flagellar basal body-associated protein FliL